MLLTISAASLIVASSWVALPAPRTLDVQSPRVASRYATAIFMQAEGEAAPAADSSGERLADFTDDLLDALAADDSPLGEMDVAPVFVKDDGAEAMEPLLSYVNFMTVADAKRKYRLHENDNGSSQVQIAVLTARINYMTKHMQANKKDYASLRGLTAMVEKRRKLLQYLLNENQDEFTRLTNDLGIRTNQLLKPKLAGARGRRV